MIVVTILALLGFALYVMTPAERQRLVHAGQALLLSVKDADGTGRAACEPFVGALRARTPWTIVTPALVALHVAIFAGLLAGPGSPGHPATLIEWGGSFGPRTTNGEWWRLLTAMFVHTGMLHLAVNLAALAQIGLLLERLVGPFAFACVYLAAGLIAGLVDIGVNPLAVTAGASGAILGLYGLLLASVVWSVRRRSPVSVPRPAWLRLAPAAILFVLYNLMNDSLHLGAELAAVAVGLSAGLVLARGIGDHTPPVRRVAVAMATTLVIVVASAVPLRGLADARPTLAQVVALEDQTSGTYDAAVTRFRSGVIAAAALAELIEREIVPELRIARARLGTLGRVPQEHRPLVRSADEYLELREESWRLRAEALRRGSMSGLQAADQAQRAALAPLERIRLAGAQ
jgi:membrane associated rhomboid family serine protease